jgi:predicted alpha/beta superfamily hydrolase
VDVWLPPQYTQHANQHFPVLYMHDGQNLFDPKLSYSGVTWGVAEAVTRLSQAGEILPCIVVGIWNTPNRFGDYLPTHPFDTPLGEKIKKRASRRPGFNQVQYVADQYLAFIVKKLKPMIDGSYRTLPEYEHTAVMGSSMGGLISLYAITEYPEVFGGAGCVSTHWPVVDRVILPYLEQKLPDPATHRIYFDRGTRKLDARYNKGQNKVDKLMAARGYQPDVNWMTRVYKGHEHHERYWQERITVPLTFLFGK